MLALAHAGLELAQAMAVFGCHVTVMGRSEHIMVPPLLPPQHACGIQTTASADDLRAI